MDLTHFKGFCDQNDVLGDVEVDFIGEFFPFVDVVEEHNEYIGFSGVEQLNFDLCLSLFGIGRVLLFFKDPSKVTGMLNEIILSAEELSLLYHQACIFTIVLPWIAVLHRQSTCVMVQSACRVGSELLSAAVVDRVVSRWLLLLLSF